MKYKDPITGEYKELFLKASDTLPIGSIVPYGSNDIPANWLLCDGRAVSRTTYANLFSVIGTNFGEGDGTTTFNLPDFRSRVPDQVVNYIIKSAMSVGVVGNVLNNKSDSKKDTYSCNYLNKNILTSFLTSQQTTSQTFGKINLDSKVSVGDKLTLNDNGIKIGAGVTKVKVSAGISAVWNSPVSNDFNLYITKNGTTESNVVIKINGAKPSTNYGGSVMLSEQLIEVKENDVLYLCLYGTINSLIYGSFRATYMTVEVVE